MREGDPEDIFRNDIPKLVQDAVSQGSEGIRKSISDWKFLRELGSVAGWIGEIATQVYRQRLRARARITLHPAAGFQGLRCGKEAT
jgi:hypothetical protein